MDNAPTSSEPTPPEGEIVDASDFWSRRNQPGASAESTSPSRTAITRLLVANRAEIACRVFRTARHLGIETVAVFSDPDRSAAHVRAADVAVAIGGNTSTESYLDTLKILAAAARSGADAIHPGYGFLSENPDFAEAVIAAGLTWVGPTPESIRSMALKVEAKRIAAAAGVPLVPGAELAAEATDHEVVTAATEVGFPLLVKASAGGGGKGMRAVSAPDGVLEAVEAARREALNSFGDPTVFFERYLTGARHVEVQIFGDTHGNVVHLFERECSIQRRHQKIVEESPSPGATTATLDRMYAAAVSLASEIGYVGAGTVEFLVFGEGAAQEFFFLEMNTRLQVEHPVTEAVTGINLVLWQLRVARGDALPLAQSDITRDGHAIEARLYAEDPANGYLPSTGKLIVFDVDPLHAPYCRDDSGFESGDEVSPFYDPMLAKIISHSSDRATATHVLAQNLRLREIAGVTTNRDSLVAILESPEFAAGATTTNFLDMYDRLLDQPLDDAATHNRLLLAATLGVDWLAGQDAPWATLVFNGWRNVAAVPQRRDWAVDGGPEPVSHAVVWSPSSADAGMIEIRELTPDTGFSGQVTGARYRVAGERAVSAAEESGVNLRLELDGIGRDYAVTSADGFVWVSDGRSCVTFRALPRFTDPDAAASAGGSVAPVPGTVVSVEVAPGDEVIEGQTLVVLEAMKMEHRITAAADGTVTEVHVIPGASVDAHQVLVTLDAGSMLDD